MDKKLLENLLQNVENKDDIINQIYVEYGKEVNKLKSDLETLKSEKLDLTSKLDGFKDYESLKETNAKLTKEIEDNKLAQEKTIKDNALNEALKTSNVKDARAIKGFLDESKLTWDNEKKSWTASIVLTIVMIIIRIATELQQADAIYDNEITKAMLDKTEVLEKYYEWKKKSSTRDYRR